MESDKNPRLTPMQLRVLQLVCQGKTSRQVADELFIGKRTVDFHLNGVYQKLKVSNRIQAYARASKMGIV